MSFTRQVTICCDHCGKQYPKSITVKKLRKELSKYGWKHFGRKDFCPTCKCEEKIIFYWNRNPNVFVDKITGRRIKLVISNMLAFEWNQMLFETIITLRNTLQYNARKDAEEINIYINPEDTYTLRTISSLVFFKPNLNLEDRSIGSILNMNVFKAYNIKYSEINVEFKTDTANSYGSIIILDK